MKVGEGEIRKFVFTAMECNEYKTGFFGSCFKGIEKALHVFCSAAAAKNSPVRFGLPEMNFYRASAQISLSFYCEC